MTKRSITDVANRVERFLNDSDGSANCIVRDDKEAHDLAVEMRRRGWKARADRGLDIENDRVIDYVQVSGLRSETRREPQIIRMVTMLGSAVDRALESLPEKERPQ